MTGNTFNGAAATGASAVTASENLSLLANMFAGEPVHCPTFLEPSGVQRSSAQDERFLSNEVLKECLRLERVQK